MYRIPVRGKCFIAARALNETHAGQKATEDREEGKCNTSITLEMEI